MSAAPNNARPIEPDAYIPPGTDRRFYEPNTGERPIGADDAKRPSADFNAVDQDFFDEGEKAGETEDSDSETNERKDKQSSGSWFGRMFRKADAESAKAEQDIKGVKEGKIGEGPIKLNEDEQTEAEKLIKRVYDAKHRLQTFDLRRVGDLRKQQDELWRMYQEWTWKQTAKDGHNELSDEVNAIYKKLLKTNGGLYDKGKYTGLNEEENAMLKEAEGRNLTDYDIRAMISGERPWLVSAYRRAKEMLENEEKAAEAAAASDKKGGSSATTTAAAAVVAGGAAATAAAAMSARGNMLAGADVHKGHERPQLASIEIDYEQLLGTIEERIEKNREEISRLKTELDEYFDVGDIFIAIGETDDPEKKMQSIRDNLELISEYALHMVSDASPEEDAVGYAELAIYELEQLKSIADDQERQAAQLEYLDNLLSQAVNGLNKTRNEADAKLNHLKDEAERLKLRAAHPEESVKIGELENRLVRLQKDSKSLDGKKRQAALKEMAAVHLEIMRVWDKLSPIPMSVETEPLPFSVPEKESPSVEELRAEVDKYRKVRAAFISRNPGTLSDKAKEHLKAIDKRLSAAESRLTLAQAEDIPARKLRRETELKEAKDFISQLPPDDEAPPTPHGVTDYSEYMVEPAKAPAHDAKDEPIEYSAMDTGERDYPDQNDDKKEPPLSPPKPAAAAKAVAVAEPKGPDEGAAEKEARKQAELIAKANKEMDEAQAQGLEAIATLKINALRNIFAKAEERAKAINEANDRDKRVGVLAINKILRKRESGLLSDEQIATLIERWSKDVTEIKARAEARLKELEAAEAQPKPKSEFDLLVEKGIAALAQIQKESVDRIGTIDSEDELMGAIEEMNKTIDRIRNGIRSATREEIIDNLAELKLLEKAELEKLNDRKLRNLVEARIAELNAVKETAKQRLNEIKGKGPGPANPDVGKESKGLDAEKAREQAQQGLFEQQRGMKRHLDDFSLQAIDAEVEHFSGMEPEEFRKFLASTIHMRETASSLDEETLFRLRNEWVNKLTEVRETKLRNAAIVEAAKKAAVSEMSKLAESSELSIEKLAGLSREAQARTREQTMADVMDSGVDTAERVSLLTNKDIDAINGERMQAIRELSERYREAHKAEIAASSEKKKTAQEAISSLLLKINAQGDALEKYPDRAAAMLQEIRTVNDPAARVSWLIEKGFLTAEQSSMLEPGNIEGPWNNLASQLEYAVKNNEQEAAPKAEPAKVEKKTNFSDSEKDEILRINKAFGLNIRTNGLSRTQYEMIIAAMKEYEQKAAVAKTMDYNSIPMKLKPEYKKIIRDLAKKE